MTSLTSPELIDQFNAAAGLAREGRYEASLAVWNALLEPDAEEIARREREGPAMMSGRFLGLAHMRRAWAMMDLDRHADARDALESEIMLACLGQLQTEELYEYYFSLGNCHGALGEIAPMDVALSRALHLAAEHLGDPERCVRCWTNLMHWAEAHRAWAYLTRECPSAIQLAENTGQSRLAKRARRSLAKARGHLTETGTDAVPEDH